MIKHPADTKQSPRALTLLFTGDIVLDVPEPDHWLSGIAPALREADLVIGHLEVPHTRRGQELAGDVPAPGADPEHLDALARAGVHALTLAGNHIADCGPEGIADTIARLDRLGIAHAGAGADLAIARRPGWLEHEGRNIALLSYNCVGPEAAWAGENRAGCNYLPVRTADGSPVTPRSPITAMDPAAREWLARDIAAARPVAGLVVVSLHQGVVHTPARIEPYERELARAALEAGADVVVCHHAHILRGISLPGGHPVFHGLGNGCVVTAALSMDQSHPARAEWARRRRELFGFEPDPRYTLAPFHPEAVHAALGVVRWHADGRLEAGVVPVYVEPPGRPVCVEDERAEAVIRYLGRIGRDAGLPALQWQRVSPQLWLCA
ncbi:MAG: CapA family protein [Pseudomonadota bacterium]|jgi:poly-gamma-glutamate capsule biosynthesis protein CapA/YwtB (metallophosphatase superfamily)|nr:MAG: capsule biosynthesis protein [Pseudomonadota bacterium]